MKDKTAGAGAGRRDRVRGLRLPPRRGAGRSSTEVIQCSPPGDITPPAHANPKGVVYSTARSTLTALAESMTDTMALSSAT